MGKSKVDAHERQALYDQGHNDHEIARRLGVTAHAIFSWRKRANLPPNATSRPRPKAASHIRVEASGIQDAPRPPRPVGDYAQRVRLLQQLWERTQAGQTAAMLRRMEGD